MVHEIKILVFKKKDLVEDILFSLSCNEKL